MRIKKSVLMGALALILVFGQALPVAAASSEMPNNEVVTLKYTASPRWTDTVIVQPSISSSGKTISIALFVAPRKSTDKSSGTIYLEQYSGNKWTSVTSWPVAKTGNVDITKTYSGKSGVKYRTKAVLTIGTDNVTSLSSEITIK